MLKTRKTMVSWQAFLSLPPCTPLVFLSLLQVPFPSLSNTCHVGYIMQGKVNEPVREEFDNFYMSDLLCYMATSHTNTHTVCSRPTPKKEIRHFLNGLVRELKVNERKLLRPQIDEISFQKVKITQVTWRKVQQKKCA